MSKLQQYYKTEAATLLMFLLGFVAILVFTFREIAINKQKTLPTSQVSSEAVQPVNMSRTIDLPYGYKFQDIRVSDTNIVIISRAAEEYEEADNYFLTVLPGNAHPDETFTINVAESGF